MKSLYFECNSGISGDMAVAAMIDLGADREALRKTLETIPVDGFQIKISRVQKSGIDCNDFDVVLDASHENHDHDMEFLFGKEHHHREHSHHHEHRGLPEIREIIQKTDMSENARSLAGRIFEIIARAEAKAHGIPVERVHFHEVGAVDSIVDVIALSVCLDDLKERFQVQNIYVPFLCEGRGTVRCAHGILPIPVPAVANIAQENALKLSFIDEEGEFVTPTGAAFAAAVKTGEKLPDRFEICQVGLGAGKRNYNRPSILRVFLIEESPVESFGEKPSFLSDKVFELNTNIDDCTGENLGFLSELLLQNGALDVTFTPCFMKKNRPANRLTVLCKAENVKSLEKLVFLHTTAIGIRVAEKDRVVLPRTEVSVPTEWGNVRVKVVRIGGVLKIYPEYESVKTVSLERGLPFDAVYQKVFGIAEKFLNEKQPSFNHGGPIWLVC